MTTSDDLACYNYNSTILMTVCVCMTLCVRIPGDTPLVSDTTLYTIAYTFSISSGLLYSTIALILFYIYNLSKQ